MCVRAFAAALAGLVWFGALACSRADAQAPPVPSPPPSTLPAAKAPQRPPMFDYELDLSVQKDPAPITVPPGQTVNMSLVHAGVPSAYRVTLEETGLAIGHGPGSTVRPSRVSPGILKPSRNCPASVESAWTALLEQRDETQVPPSIAALRTAAGGPPCMDSTNLLVSQTRVLMNSPRMLQTGRTLRYTVERLGADGQTAERKWTVVFRPGRADFGWEYPTEQAYVAAAVLQDLHDVAAFAAGATPASSARVKVSVPAVDAPDRLRFEVASAGSPLTGDLAVAPHVWAPELYADAAARILASRKLRAAADSAGSPTFFADVADLKASVLLRESRRVGERLTKAPLDARAHEEAAFLWGAFGLREGTGRYADNRLTIARASAHLALARALRAGRPPSREGAWAAVFVPTLVGRAADASRLIVALGTAEAERPWRVALGLRNDGDWRKVEAPAKRTLVEQLEFVRAKAGAIGGLAALAALDGANLEAVPDWARITSASGWSVEEGHRFASSAVALELRDLALALDAKEDLTVDLPRTAALLVRRHEPIVRRGPGPAAVEVLGPGTWSQSAARNVISQIEWRDYFLRSMLRLPDQATAYRDAILPLIAPQPLMPVVRVWFDPKSGPESPFCGEMRSVLAKDPLAVPAETWAGIAERRCALTTGLPPALSFFDPIVPTGTGFDAASRMVTGQLGLALATDRLREFRALAPLDSRLVFASLSREYKGAIPVEVISKEFAPFAEYQVSAARQALRPLEKDPVAHRRMAEKLCALAADHCSALAYLLILAGEEDAAAVAYQRAIDQSLDRVGASHDAGWLVSYYEERNQPDRALAVARVAEEVGSGNGFIVMARLLERRGRLEEAEQRYLHNKQRYEDERSLQTFYIRSRNQPGGERWAAQADAAMKALFPSGVERLGAIPATPPAINAGAIFTQPSKGLIAAGIRPGDVCVGLDGYVVRNDGQYGDVKALSLAPTMKLTVWHDGKYVEVEERRDRINYFR